MKILVAGDWHSDLHEEVVSRTLKNLGHELEGFKWSAYFKRKPGRLGALAHLIARFQNKYLIGSRVRRINRDLIHLTKRFQPEVLFVYRGTHIPAGTLRAIKTAVPNCILVGYNNDDPFSPTQPRYLWRHFLEALPEYDLVLAYRQCNIPEYLQAGVRRVELLRSWFVPERNHPVVMTEPEKALFETDVVFIGHFEPDQRLEYLEEIVRQGFWLRLFGPGREWDSVLRKSPILSPFAPLHLVWGQDYNRAIGGAKIALCFFSKLNRDTYTRRCFEIPASGALLLSEFSEDLAGIYREGVEADFFKSKDEMIEKIRGYLADPNRLASVAKAGNLRVHADGHDVTSRMKQVVEWVQDIRVNGRNEFQKG